MDEESHIYSPETLISLYTNKPANDTAKCHAPIFWCESCRLKLSTPTIAVQHMSGRSHNAKVNANKDSANETQNNALKRKCGLDSSNIKPSESIVQEPASKKNKEKGTKAVVQEPATKKNKEQPAKPDPNLKCDDCNLEFLSGIIALQHFKGKKHAKMIVAKVAAKQNQGQRGGQRGGRGYAGRGRGRGGGFWRGRGLFRGGIFNNGGISSGVEGRQLMRTLKNVYGAPSDNLLNIPNSSDYLTRGNSNYSNNYDNTNSSSNISYGMNTGAGYDFFFQ